MSSWTSLMPTAWPAKTVLKLFFFASQTNATASGDHDGFVVEGIVDVRQSAVHVLGRLVDLRRALHVQRLLRQLVVEDLDTEEYIPMKQDSEVDRHSPLYTICAFSSAPNLLHQSSPLGWGMQDFMGSNSKSEVAHVPSCPFRLQIHS